MAESNETGRLLVAALCVVREGVAPREGQNFAKCEDRFRIRSRKVAVVGRGDFWELVLKIEGDDVAKLAAFLEQHQQRRVVLTKKEVVLRAMTIHGTTSDRVSLTFDTEEDAYDMLLALMGEGIDDELQ